MFVAVLSTTKVEHFPKFILKGLYVDVLFDLMQKQRDTNTVPK